MARYTSMGCGCNFAYTISCPALKIPERPCTTGPSDGTFITGANLICSCTTALWAFGGVQCAINADLATDPDFNNILITCCVLKTCPCIQFAFGTGIGACTYIGTYYWRTRLISDSYEVSAFSNTGCVCTCTGCAGFQMTNRFTCPIQVGGDSKCIDWCCCYASGCYGPLLTSTVGTKCTVEECVVVSFANTAACNTFDNPLWTETFNFSNGPFCGCGASTLVTTCQYFCCYCCDGGKWSINVCGDTLGFKEWARLTTRTMANTAIGQYMTPSLPFKFRTCSTDINGVVSCSDSNYSTWYRLCRPLKVFALENGVGPTATEQGCCCIQLYSIMDSCYCFGQDPSNLRNLPYGVMGIKYEVSYDCTFSADVAVACGPANVFIPKASITGWGSCPQFYVRATAIYGVGGHLELGLDSSCAKVPNVTFTNWTACYDKCVGYLSSTCGHHPSACCSGTISHTGEIYVFGVGSGGVPWYWCYGAWQPYSGVPNCGYIPCANWCRLKTEAASPGSGYLLNCSIDNSSGTLNGCTFCMRAGFARGSDETNLNLCCCVIMYWSCTGLWDRCNCCGHFLEHVCGIVCCIDTPECALAASMICICGADILVCARGGNYAGGGIGPFGPCRPWWSCGVNFNNKNTSVTLSGPRGMSGYNYAPDQSCTTSSYGSWQSRIPCCELCNSCVVTWTNTADPFSPFTPGNHTALCTAVTCSLGHYFDVSGCTPFNDGTCYLAGCCLCEYGCCWRAPAHALGCYDTNETCGVISYGNCACCFLNVWGMGGSGAIYRFSNHETVSQLCNGQRGFGFGAAAAPVTNSVGSFCFFAYCIYQMNQCGGISTYVCCDCYWGGLEAASGGNAGLLLMCNHPAAYTGYCPAVCEAGTARVGLVTFACQGFGD